jgi:hypothetical protein
LRRYSVFKERKKDHIKKGGGKATLPLPYEPNVFNLHQKVKRVNPEKALPVLFDEQGSKRRKLFGCEQVSREKEKPTFFGVGFLFFPLFPPYPSAPAITVGSFLYPIDFCMRFWVSFAYRRGNLEIFE